MKAIEMELVTELTWSAANRFEKAMPNLESLDLYCSDRIFPEQRIEIDSFINRYASQGKRASCQQI